jgi:hypothetical protein
MFAWSVSKLTGPVKMSHFLEMVADEWRLKFDGVPDFG